MTITISIAHNNARLAGTIAHADAGTPASRIRLYDASDVLLATMVLSKPCGAIVANKLVLEQADPSGDMVVAQGAAVKGVWISGAGDPMLEGSVTDEAGDGDFKVSGTTGTMLYAGARAILGTTELL